MSDAEHIWDRELLLVTGKGGVGKTTVTAALARAAHVQGGRVLVAEVATDVAKTSPLLRLFGRTEPLGETPVSLEDRLDGLRITPSAGHRLFLKAALRVGMLADAAMRSAALNRFLMAAPAFPEIGTLYMLVELLREKRYDHIVIDLPATGHALGLVSLPKTVLKVLPKTGLIGTAIQEGLDALTDSERSGVVLVTLPESLPVQEAIELEDGLQKLDVPVRSLVLNRLPHNPFTAEERAALDVHMKSRPAGSPLLGTRELRRLERALNARDDFRARVPPRVKRIEISKADAVESAEILEHVGLVLRHVDVTDTAPLEVDS